MPPLETANDTGAKLHSLQNEHLPSSGHESTPSQPPSADRLPWRPPKQTVGGLSVVLLAILLSTRQVHLRGSPRAPALNGTAQGQTWQWDDWGKGVGEAAAIRKRYVQVKAHFMNLIHENDAKEGWHVIAKSRDGKLKVSLKKAEQKGEAPYVIADGVYNVSADRLFEVVRVRNMNKVQPKLDPFFANYSTVRTHDSQMEIGRRSTKKLIVYGPRDFAFGTYEEKSRRQLVTGAVSLPSHPLIPEVKGFTRAYQDLVIFVTPITSKSAKVHMVMRTDLRGNIPSWLFTSTCGKTGMEVLKEMEKIAKTLTTK